MRTTMLLIPQPQSGKTWPSLTAVGALLLALFSGQAAADTPGWLRYADGNLLSGRLIEGGVQGGLFRSDRFGEVRFKAGEAVFAPSDMPRDADDKPTPAAAPAWAIAEWQPSDWSIGVSGYWKSDQGSVSKDIALDLDSTWKSPGNELKLNLSTDYKTVDKAVDNNEQTGGLRWLRDLRSPWFVLGSVKARRSTISLDPLPTLDYLLLQGTAGLGLRKSWSAKDQTLVALGRDRIAVDLLSLDRRVYTSATSFLLENKLQLSPRVSFGNTLFVYFWRDGSTGFDSLADLSYKLSEQLSVGLRHEYRRNAANLEIGSFSRFSLTTRLGF